MQFVWNFRHLRCRDNNRLTERGREAHNALTVSYIAQADADWKMAATGDFGSNMLGRLMERELRRRPLERRHGSADYCWPTVQSKLKTANWFQL
jgi:hypothetical protein